LVRIGKPLFQCRDAFRQFKCRAHVQGVLQNRTRRREPHALTLSFEKRDQCSGRLCRRVGENAGAPVEQRGARSVDLSAEIATAEPAVSRSLGNASFASRFAHAATSRESKCEQCLVPPLSQFGSHNLPIPRNSAEFA
jgi:hypothetical protein